MKNETQYFDWIANTTQNLVKTVFHVSPRQRPRADAHLKGATRLQHENQGFHHNPCMKANVSASQNALVRTGPINNLEPENGEGTY